MTNITRKSLQSGFSLPVVGLGTWTIGGRMESDNSQDEHFIDVIRDNIHGGITLIDTAELYGNGHTEELIGLSIHGIPRDSLFITSKVKLQNLAYNDCITACEKSLQRLGVEFLDLYLIHKRSLDISLSETMRALDVLVERGLIKHIGVSNFSVQSFQEAQSYTKNKIVVNQCHYNLQYREPEASGLLKYCQENDVFLQAWRPIELGELISGSSPSLQSICLKYQKTPSQVALKWLISQKNVITVVKMSTDEHISENLALFDWEMKEGDIEFLRISFEQQNQISNREPLL